MIFKFKVRYLDDDYLIDVENASISEIEARIRSIIGPIDETFVLRVWDGESFVRFGDIELRNLSIPISPNRIKMTLSAKSQSEKKPVQEDFSNVLDDLVKHIFDVPAACGKKTPVHSYVTCDGCNMSPISGLRFKCTVCYDFDLCEKCFRENKHPLDHPMVVFRIPHVTNNRRCPFRKNSPCQNNGNHNNGIHNNGNNNNGNNNNGIHNNGNQRRCAAGFFHSLRDALAASTSAAASTASASTSTSSSNGVSTSSSNGVSNSSSTGVASSSSNGAANSATCSNGGNNSNRVNNAGCGNGASASCSNEPLLARFVKDVTLFDGVAVAPATRLSKVWRMRNTGSKAWPEDTRLIFVGGDALSHAHPEGIHVGPIAPSLEVDIAAELVSPVQAGRYIGYWRLMGAGARFGHRVWCEIRVEEENDLLEQERISDAIAQLEAHASIANDHPIDHPIDQPVLNEQQQPVLNEQQVVVNEQQPVLNEQQPVLNEQQVVVNEQQPIVNEHQAGANSPGLGDYELVEADEHHELIALLHTMGFCDTPRIRMLISQHGPEINPIINALLN